jgi:hypothetical protein
MTERRNELLAELYSAAAHACRPLDFSQPPAPAIDAVEELVRGFEAEQRLRLAELAKKLRAISARPPASPETMGKPPADLIPAAEAGKTARRSKQTIARWCAAHPWEAPGGFAIFIRGRWHVSKASFSKFLSQRPAR